MSQTTEYNLTTGEVITREFTESEKGKYDSWKEYNLKLEQEKAEAATKRQALLDKLGITKDEAKLLLS